MLDFSSVFTQSEVYGRKSELDYLDSLYYSEGYKGISMYGQRQVGKTTILRKFCSDHQGIYYQAISGYSESQFVQDFGKLLVDVVKQDNALVNAIRASTSLIELLRIAFYISSIKRIAIIIDEFPYILRTISSICSEIQALIDEIRDAKECNLLFVLCGSNIEMMQNIISEESPLYGRLQPLKIDPISFSRSGHWLAQYSISDAIKVYAITGGVPGYLKMAQRYNTFEDYISGTFLGRYGVQKPSLCNSRHIDTKDVAAVLTQILQGETELNKIVQKSGLSTETAVKTVESLVASGVVRCKHPIFSKGMSKMHRYTLADSYIEFWYLFIASLLDPSLRMNRLPLSSIDSQKFLTFVGPRFEEICSQYLAENIISMIRMGYWEDKVQHRTNDGGLKTSREEIDIVFETESYLGLAECKFTSDPVNKDVVEKLIWRGTFVDSGLPRKYFVFSRSGYIDSAISMAETNLSIKLLSLADFKFKE